MSRPELAVQAVELLTDLGYGAGVELPSDGARDSVVVAWPTEDNAEATTIPALVRAVDRRAVEQHAAERDAFGHPRVESDLLHEASHEGESPREAGRRHDRVVQPRRVWSGVACAAIGIVVSGVGLMAQTWWVVGVGAGLVLVGVVALLSGGGMYDVHATRPLGEELHELEEGESHEGAAPGEMLHDARVARSAGEIERGRQRVMSRAGRRRRR